MKVHNVVRETTEHRPTPEGPVGPSRASLMRALLARPAAPMPMGLFMRLLARLKGTAS